MAQGWSWVSQIAVKKTKHLKNKTSIAFVTSVCEYHTILERTVKVISIVSMIGPTNHFLSVLRLKSLFSTSNPLETRSFLTSLPAVFATSKLRDAVTP